MEISYARKDLGDYWKNMMNDQPMPEAIQNLIQTQHEPDAAAGNAHFIRDFDVHPNIILYHTHVDHMKQKQNFESAVSSNRKSLLNNLSKRVEPARNK